MDKFSNMAVINICNSNMAFVFEGKMGMLSLINADYTKKSSPAQKNCAETTFNPANEYNGVTANYIGVHWDLLLYCCRKYLWVLILVLLNLF